jgi:hypothetical protein
MLEILSAIFAAILGAFAIIMSVAFLRVARAGRGKVAYLRRKQYGLKAWATGGLPKMNRGTTVHELEGIELKASNGRLSYVRQTRAPTFEI